MPRRQKTQLPSMAQSQPWWHPRRDWCFGAGLFLLGTVVEDVGAPLEWRITTIVVLFVYGLLWPSLTATRRRVIGSVSALAVYGMVGAVSIWMTDRTANLALRFVDPKEPLLLIENRS